MEADVIKTLFSMGVKVACHVNGVRLTGDVAHANAAFEVLKQVADGDLTLLPTYEEFVANLPKPPAGLKMTIDPTAVREQMRIARENERIAARMI